MSEHEYKRPHPVPTFEDYAVAADFVNDLLEAQGGPWTYYHKTAIVDTRPATRNLLKSMSSHARHVEPLKDEGLYVPVDPMFRATHSFRAGMWSGGFIAQELFGAHVGYTTVHNMLTQTVPHEEVEDNEQYEANGDFLMSIGDEGMKTIGPAAREYIYAWGNEIVSDYGARRYFALGAGAVLYTFHNVYEQSYETLKLDYDASRLGDEVSRYLAGVADSSEN